MYLFDTHCDTISEIYDKDLSLAQNNLHIDLNRMKKYEGYGQFFAVFSNPEYLNIATERCVGIIQRFFAEMKQHENHIDFCKNNTDYVNAIKKGKIGAFLSLEGADSITSIAQLERFYNLGVRCISFTWNHSNQLGTGAGESSPNIGLTPLGKDILRKMKKLGIIFDVSHLSERGFWDAVEIMDIPFIASHSNAKSLCNHNRNLTNEQFKAIMRVNGCVGINFYPFFLTGKHQATITDIIRHIEHFLSLGGENNIGIGADFDGVDILPVGIDGVEDIGKVFEEMLKLGYSDSLIKKITNDNFQRIITDIL